MSAKVLEIPRNPAALAPADLTDSELADEYGENDRQYQCDCKPVIDRRKDLETELQARTDKKRTAHEELLFDGLVWRAKVAEKGWETILPPMDSIHRMFRAAKQDFYAAISITQKAIKEALGEPAFDKMKTRERTGYRKVTAVLKIQPKAS